MIDVDGSHGEGGGQLLRMAVALSALTETPVRVVRIRAGRPTPGLAAQHVTAIHAIAALCAAESTGVAVGASSIEFRPGKLTPGRLSFDVGTAGSVTLVLQALCRWPPQPRDPFTCTSLEGRTYDGLLPSTTSVGFSWPSCDPSELTLTRRSLGVGTIREAADWWMPSSSRRGPGHLFAIRKQAEPGGSVASHMSRTSRRTSRSGWLTRRSVASMALRT